MNQINGRLSRDVKKRFKQVISKLKGREGSAKAALEMPFFLPQEELNVGFSDHFMTYHSGEMMLRGIEETPSTSRKRKIDFTPNVNYCKRHKID